MRPVIEFSILLRLTQSQQAFSFTNRINSYFDQLFQKVT